MFFGDGAMACRGAFLGLTREQIDEVLTRGGGEDLIEHLEDLCDQAVYIQEREGKVYWQETDKAWDAMHRCLAEVPPPPPESDGDQEDDDSASVDHGSYPLKLAVLGGRPLYTVETDYPDYLVHLVEPHEVKDLAAALASITRDQLRAKYLHHCDGAFPEFGDEDFEYTWEWFEATREFYIRMAAEGRAVIFFVDQ
jgi:hypothetical protein